MKTSTVTALAVGTGALCIVGIFGIAATADERNEAAYTVVEPQERTAEEKIAASQKANKKNTVHTPKDKGYTPDPDAVADIAWLMIDASDREAICLSYMIDPAGTLDSAREIWRSQGHDTKTVKAMSKVVRKNC